MTAFNLLFRLMHRRAEVDGTSMWTNYPNRWNGPPLMQRPAPKPEPLKFPEIDPSLIPAKEKV